jgi:hypothetical protein
VSLPTLNLHLIPDVRCTRCGQLGYVHDRTTLCMACTNISLLRWAARKNLNLRERMIRNWKEATRLYDEDLAKREKK